jgi:predicted methyltransferase
LKGRTLSELAPSGKVWRTGANEATVIETSQDLKIEGKELAAGKYSIYSIPGEKEWTIIFNKAWKNWGTVYNESDDILRIQVKAGKSKAFTEMMSFEIVKEGKVHLLWGDTQISFGIQ